MPNQLIRSGSVCRSGSSAHLSQASHVTSHAKAPLLSSSWISMSGLWPPDIYVHTHLRVSVRLWLAHWAGLSSEDGALEHGHRLYWQCSYQAEAFLHQSNVSMPSMPRRLLVSEGRFPCWAACCLLLALALLLGVRLKHNFVDSYVETASDHLSSRPSWRRTRRQRQIIWTVAQSDFEELLCNKCAEQSPNLILRSCCVTNVLRCMRCDIWLYIGDAHLSVAVALLESPHRSNSSNSDQWCPWAPPLLIVS